MGTKFTLKFFLLFSFLNICYSGFTQSAPQLQNASYHESNPLPWFAEFSQPQLSETEFWSWFRTNYTAYHQFQFIIETDQRDNLGFRHIRYHQAFNNYPVNHTAIILHIRDGVVESFNSDLFSFTPLEALTHLTASKTLDVALKQYNNIYESVENTSPEVIWAKTSNGYTQDPFFLCHAYRIKIAEGLKHEKIYINEVTGQVVLTENLITHADTLNKAKTLYRGIRNFTADFKNTDSFRLRESGKRKISTFLQTNGTDFWNRTNNWKDSSRATNDIHWGTEVVMDMLKKRFNVNSFDNKGTLLYNLSQPVSSGNAFWTLGGNYVNYYTGTSGTVTPCASLDVVGHELGHGVADGVAKLAYSGESGALHESFADIQGYITERTGDSTKYDWIVGDQVWVGGIRNMAKPKLFSNPNTYKGQYWGGGFHSNGGVQNHWFYTLVRGDTGTNDNSYSYFIKGLGFEKSVSIVYRAMLNYVTPNTDFPMMATFHVKAAKDLYGSCGPEAAMTKESWKAAGIIDTSSIIDYSHGISNQKLFCGTNNHTVSFTSKGDIARKCTWYFSKTDSLKAVNASKTFTSSGTYTIYLKTEVCNKIFLDTTTVSLSLNPIASLKAMNARYCQSSDSLTITNLSVNTESPKPIYFSWIVGPFNNYNAGKKDIRIAKDISGDYYIELKAYYANGCQDTASLIFSVLGSVKPSFTVKNVCPCQDMKLKNTTDISASTYTFKWQFDDTTVKTQFQPLKNYCRSRKHSVILYSTDLNTKCTDSSIRYVDIFERPVPKIGIKSFCFGDSVKLYDQSTHNRKIAYNEWIFGFWNPQNMDSVMFQVADTLEKTFKLTVYDDLGCENSTSIKAKPEILNVDFTANNFCTTQSTNLNAKITNRMPLVDYYWIINNVKKYAGNLNPSEKFTPQIVNATFWAQTNACKAIKNKTFEIYEAPKADFSVASEVCSGDTFHFRNKSIYTKPVTHIWDFAGASKATTKDVNKAWTVNSATTYVVCLKEENNFVCSDSLCKFVTVNENPKCDFNIEKFWINYDGRGYKFIVTQGTHPEYTWDFGDGTKGNANNQVHQYTNDGNYTIKVKVKSNSGCICETSKTLNVLKSDIANVLFSQVKIYPNPNEGLLNIAGLTDRDYVLKLYSLDGKLVMERQFNTATSEDLRNLSKGIYLLKLSDGNSSATFKIELR